MRNRILRWLSAMLGISMTFAGLAPVAFAAFADVKANTQFSTAITALQRKGTIAGYADGTFRAGSSINRAEFLKIVLASRGAVKASADPDCFPDVRASQWFSAYVCPAKEENIVSGYPDGSFKPERMVTFAEAAKIMAGAFRQSAEGGIEWYEPHVRALEASKAIPPTIAGLDRPITRGEMAEMMWRLTEKRTDQPSKGYLNVKYPELAVNFASDDVQTAKSCRDLEAVAEGVARTRSWNAADEGIAAPTMGRVRMMDGAAEESTAAPGDYSKTNIQVEGVDEGDIVKTDGRELYIVDVYKVRLVRATPASAMKEDATIDFSAEHFAPSDLYIDGSTLVIIGPHWDSRPVPVTTMGASWSVRELPMRATERTEVRLYDVSDPTKPKALRTLLIDGSQVSTRLIGSKLYLVTRTNPLWYGGPIPLKEDTLVPQMRDSKAGKETPVVRCNEVVILPHTPQPAYLTVAVIPTGSATGEVKREVILGDGQNVYSSLQNLYVASTEWNYGWNPDRPRSTESTNVFRFAIDGDGVTFKAKGSVPGHILNQFSMDEHASTFRIATTRGQAWVETAPSSNSLYILNMDMHTVGSVEDIAPGESIYSVRFMGDRAYMVTFKQIDPLFVIDTSDPRNPKILGRLKIPGYSNYLHPYDENHLIGFGKEVDESIDADKVHSKDAVYYTAVQGMKLALFDVTDVSNPREMYKEVIGDRGTDSPLLTNHKALLFDRERGLLAFPVTVYKFGDPLKSGDTPEAMPVFQGAYVYDLSLKNGFTLKGTITHQKPDAFATAGGYWYGGERNVERIVRIGESLLTISNAMVQNHKGTDVSFQGKVEFGGEKPPPEIYR
ncbi:MAG: beta propeller domain-containing protein [Candidatus Peregrinibacteria bacterium Greene0416_19]|nr:MAG: beta propeller domain-containing protein [Candidatus Peregrinibacteria bacterium Greene0416_19]